MRILDRYIVKGFLLPFFYCLVIFIFLYIIIDLFGHLDEILRQNVRLVTLCNYYLSCIPAIFVQTIPIAVLLSTIYTLGALNKYNETVALKASGVSLYQLVRPFFILGLLISISTFIVNDKFVPTSSLRSTTIKKEQLEKKKPLKPKVLHNVAMYGEGGRLFHIGSFDLAKKRLENITVLEHDENQKVISKVTAQRADWIGDKWKLYDGLTYELDPEGEMKGKPLAFKEKVFDIPETPKDFLKAEQYAEFMNVRQLKEHIKRISGSGVGTVRKLSVDLHYKLAFPFVSLVLVLIGIPFSLSTSRGGALLSIGICIGISFSFYGVMAVSIALGKGGMLSPWLAAWSAHLLFGGIGIVLIGMVKS